MYVIIDWNTTNYGGTTQTTPCIVMLEQVQWVKVMLGSC